MHPPVDPMAWSVHHQPQPAAPIQNAAVMVTVDLQRGYIAPAVEGSATVCRADGRRSIGKYHGEVVHDTSRIGLMLKMSASDLPVTNLTGNFSSGVFNIIWPFDTYNAAALDGTGAMGALHKGTREQFEALCGSGK